MFDYDGLILIFPKLPLTSDVLEVLQEFSNLIDAEAGRPGYSEFIISVCTAAIAKAKDLTAPQPRYEDTSDLLKPSPIICESEMGKPLKAISARDFD